MKQNLLVLKRFIEALGIHFGIETVDDRKRVQKAVYLGQLTGVDLGYRFGWYLMGPYSPPLTRDYYELTEQLKTEPEPEGELNHKVRERLQQIAPLLTPPNEFEQDQEAWLELLASYDFLLRVRRKTPATAREVLEREKPNLSGTIPLAVECLANLPA